MHYMNMDLRSLKHVVVLAKLLSYTKAAQELCMTQSALSRSIQTIEKHLQLRLFDRDRGGVHLTPLGRAFVLRAAALLRDADDLERTLRRSANAEIGEVAFGVGPLPARALLPTLLTEAIATSPDLCTNVMVRSIDALLPALFAEKIEFLVCAEGQVPKSEQLKSVFLGWFPISLLVRAGHPVLKAATGHGNRKYPLLSSGQFQHSDRWPSYFRPYLGGPVHVIEDYAAVVLIAAQTDAIWLCSNLAASTEIRAGRLKEIPPPQGQRAERFRMMMYSLDRRSLSPAALKLKTKFQDLIRALGRDVSQQPKTVTLPADSAIADSTDLTCAVRCEEIPARETAHGSYAHRE
jgi:DNA-binding transcriptional LysR family regulator